LIGDLTAPDDSSSETLRNLSRSLFNEIQIPFDIGIPPLTELLLIRAGGGLIRELLPQDRRHFFAPWRGLGKMYFCTSFLRSAKSKISGAMT
jgi:hypothetical protein